MYSFTPWLGEKGRPVFPVQNHYSLTKEDAKSGYRANLPASFDTTVGIGNLLTVKGIGHL